MGLRWMDGLSERGVIRTKGANREANGHMGLTGTHPPAVGFHQMDQSAAGTTFLRSALCRGTEQEEELTQGEQSFMTLKWCCALGSLDHANKS